MQKEIFEQPQTVKACINEYVDTLRDEINIYNLPWNLKEVKSISLIGCVPAYHACMMARSWIENLTDLDVVTEIASEFRYKKIILKKIIYIYSFLSLVRQQILLRALELCKKIK